MCIRDRLGYCLEPKKSSPHDGTFQAELLDDGSPVSYTHLDVYKRQGVQCGRDLIRKCCEFPVFERKTAKERLCCNGVYQRSACADGRKLVRQRFTICCTGVQIKFLQVFHLRTFCSIIYISRCV